jgi:SAM-dependent methyltransferase
VAEITHKSFRDFRALRPGTGENRCALGAACVWSTRLAPGRHDAPCADHTEFDYTGPIMTEPDREIRRRVRRQYEKYPYPPPLPDLDALAGGANVKFGCPSGYFHWYWPYLSATDDLDILVAGCGTNEAPEFAINLPGARITAIDISRHSLDHTARLVARHGLANVEIHELAIEDLARLGRDFDLIFCSGVLHHLAAPERGLDALAGALRPQGSLHLELYGKYGRDGVYYLQDMFRRIGMTADAATAADVAAIRDLLDLLPPGHPFAARRAMFMDVAHDTGIVDLFLHPQDRGYAVPDLYRLLAGAGLKMQRMLLRAHYALRCSALARTPFAARIAALPEAEQFAVVELFRAAVPNHLFVACHQDRRRETYRTDLDAAGWKNLVPIPALGLIADTDGLPEGRVRWLRWVCHFFPEIRLALGAIEAAIFDLVDGRRSIGEIQRMLDLRGGSAAEIDANFRDYFATLVDFDYVWLRGG